jgi:hypothetical protein
MRSALHSAAVAGQLQRRRERAPPALQRPGGGGAEPVEPQ